MSQKPYSPAAGRTNRYILFAGADKKIEKLDESVKQGGGVSFSADWLSQALNRKDTRFMYTLRMLTLMYTAEADTTVTVKASGDGGITFSESKVVPVVATTLSRTRTVSVGFGTTGVDLRFQLVFDTDVNVLVTGYIPRLVRRGRVEYQ